MNDLPSLVYPEHYHRPVAHISDVEWFQQRTAEVLNEHSIDELRRHAEEVLAYDHEKPYEHHPVFHADDQLDKYVEYSHALSAAKSRWKRRALQRSYREPIEAVQKFQCVVGYTWQPHEGSRFPERYEPEYLTLGITPICMFKAVYHARHGGHYFMRIRSLTHEELVAVWIATH